MDNHFPVHLKKQSIISIFLYFLLLSFPRLAISQSKDTVELTVYYNVEHITDTIDATNAKEAVLKYPMVLFIGKRLSYCASKNKLYEDSVIKTTHTITDPSTGIERPSGPLLSLPRLTVNESTVIYKNGPEKKIMEIKTIVGNNYNIADTLNNINWQIKDEEKNIQGLKCQMATAKYKGRAWNVWFSPDVPVPNGPWKLGGLPGLIVEASDDRKQISFTFGGVVTGHNLKETVITVPDNPKKVSKREFNKLLKAYANDPMGFAIASMGGDATGGDATYSDGANIKSPKLRIPNDPIDLSGE